MQLKKQFPDFGVKIPPKKWFGTVDDKTVKLRRDALHEFVQKLLSHAAIRELPEVRDFLNLEVIQKRAAQQTVDEPNDLEMFEQAEEADESNRMNLGATERKGQVSLHFSLFSLLSYKWTDSSKRKNSLNFGDFPNSRYFINLSENGYTKC